MVLAHKKCYSLRFDAGKATRIYLLLYHAVSGAPNFLPINSSTRSDRRFYFEITVLIGLLSYWYRTGFGTVHPYDQKLRHCLHQL